MKHTLLKLAAPAWILTCMLTVTSAGAQETPEDASGTVSESKTTTYSVTEEVEWKHEDNQGRSGLGMSNTQRPGKTKVIKSSTEISRVIDLSERPVEQQCESDIDIEYYQRDTEAEVRTLFTSSDCDDFDATYELQIMYFDSAGKFQRFVTEERWPSGQSEQQQSRYPLGNDSELRRVSSRILSCACKSDQ